LNAEPAKTAEGKADRFGGVATRRARPESDGSANRFPIASVRGSVRSGRASRPASRAGRRTSCSVSLCLCG